MGCWKLAVCRAGCVKVVGALTLPLSLRLQGRPGRWAWGKTREAADFEATDTHTGRKAHWWWVAAKEKQEGMLAWGNASPRSWHLPQQQAFLRSPSCVLLLSDVLHLSPQGLEMEAGLQQQRGGSAFDLAVLQQAPQFPFKHPWLRSTLAWQAKWYLNTDSQLVSFPHSTDKRTECK